MEICCDCDIAAAYINLQSNMKEIDEKWFISIS